MKMKCMYITFYKPKWSFDTLLAIVYFRKKATDLSAVWHTVAYRYTSEIQWTAHSAVETRKTWGLVVFVLLWFMCWLCSGSVSSERHPELGHSITVPELSAAPSFQRIWSLIFAAAVDLLLSSLWILPFYILMWIVKLAWEQSGGSVS